MPLAAVQKMVLKRDRETSKGAFPYLKGTTELSLPNGPTFQMGKWSPRKYPTKGPHPGGCINKVCMTICEGQCQCGLKTRKK